MDKADEAPLPLCAFIAVDRSDLLAQAAASAQRYAKGAPLSVLDGVPIAVKDEMAQRGFRTTCGTKDATTFGAQPATEDATVVRRLRDRGALLIGKTNMQEVGISPIGANYHHGMPRNPHDPTRHTGGSSAGSASAVAAGLCPIAIGADGGGSIRIPAALCGCVGLKATWGRISGHGAVPLCPSVGHIGPMAASVRDCAIAYAAIAGADAAEQQAQQLQQLQPPPHLAALVETARGRDLNGLRIGIYQPFFEHAAPAIVRACRQTLDQLCARGAVLVQIVLPELEETRVAHLCTILSEMRAYVVPQITAHQRLAYTTRLTLAAAAQYRATDYVQAQQMRARAIGHLRAAFAVCDVIATPATGSTAPPIYAGGELFNAMQYGRVMRFSALANLTGVPGTCRVLLVLVLVVVTLG